MATRIGSYNEDAFNAVKAMTKANAAVSQASERISSGLRVNHAADDPGGLALATRLQAQVSSNSKVMDNLYQAVAVTQIVDDSLSQINDLLTNMKTLALSSATSTVDSTQRAINQVQFEDYRNTIDSIANSALWNGSSLLNGDTTSMSIHSGTGSTDTTTLNFESVLSTAIGGVIKISDLDISTQAGGELALDSVKKPLDNAMDSISSLQGYIGAKQNILEIQSAVASNRMTIQSEAIGHIMNADLATETANLAAGQIQQEASTAMLAQSISINKSMVSYLLNSGWN
jgi:flagellin